jgi:DNA-nicking Smr family endonuclease
MQMPRRPSPLLGLDALEGVVRLLERQARDRREAERQEELKRRRAEAEANVFRSAVADATPLPDPGKVIQRPPRLNPAPRQRQADEREVLDQSISDEIDIEALLETDESLSWRRSGIGADVVRKLRRGQWSIRGQIDLHGLRVDEARLALVEFLVHARRNEWRCLRVIHGKGLGSPSREPVLKGKALKWLAQREEVMAFCQARPNDGGSGALIVLIRGPRYSSPDREGASLRSQPRPSRPSGS